MPPFLDDDKEWADPIPEAAVMELTPREGFALERLAKKYFEYAGGMGKVYSSVEYVLPDRGNLEIDVVAEPEFEDAASEHRIVLCSCKRNCRRHVVRKTMADFDLYLKLRRDDGASWEDHNVFSV